MSTTRVAKSRKYAIGGNLSICGRRPDRSDVNNQMPRGDIEEKFQFYSNLVGEREAKRLVVERGYLLARSLEKRLKPRLEEVEKSGVKDRWNRTLINRLSERTNKQWEKYKLGEARKGRPAS